MKSIETSFSVRYLSTRLIDPMWLGTFIEYTLVSCTTHRSDVVGDIHRIHVGKLCAEADIAQHFVGLGRIVDDESQGALRGSIFDAIRKDVDAVVGQSLENLPAGTDTVLDADADLLDDHSV